MDITITETIGSTIEILKNVMTVEIADYEVGLHQMLEAIQSNTIIATGNITLTNRDKTIQFIDPGGSSRNITLPAEGMANHGFVFYNLADAAGELLIIKDDAGAEVCSVYPGGAGWVLSGGASWKSFGLGTTDEATKRIVHWRIAEVAETLIVGDAKDVFTIPQELNGYNLIECNVAVDVASSSGLPSFQLRKITDAVDMLSTAVSIDANELNSYSAATPPVIDTAHDDVATGDRIAADIDGVGTGTKGATFILVFQKP